MKKKRATGLVALFLCGSDRNSGDAPDKNSGDAPDKNSGDAPDKIPEMLRTKKTAGGENPNRRQLTCVY